MRATSDEKMARTAGQIFANRLKAIRLRREWSANDLAIEVRRLGGTISRGTIAKLETGTRGSRGVTLDEAIELAVALNVPLPLMFLPLGEEEDRIALAPNLRIHPHLALDWITGEGPLVNEDGKARDLKSWNELATPMWLFQSLREYQDAVSEAATLRSNAGGEEQAVAQERLDGALRQLGQHLSYMQREGLSVPEMPSDWVARLADLQAKGGN